MPYQKIVTVYSRRERSNLHAQGIWVDKSGMQLPIKDMSWERLEKLMQMLVGWACDEDGSIGDTIRKNPISAHIALRVVSLKMYTPSAYIYRIAFGLENL